MNSTEQKPTSGWFILCDSPNAESSQYVRGEVDLIKSMEASEESLPPNLVSALGGLQWFDLSAGPFEARITELIDNLKTREME